MTESKFDNSDEINNLNYQEVPVASKLSEKTLVTTTCVSVDTIIDIYECILDAESELEVAMDEENREWNEELVFGATSVALNRVKIIRNCMLQEPRIKQKLEERGLPTDIVIP